MLDFAKGVVGVCQLKGGVGATTMAAAMASCWARHGLRVALVDVDDLNPQLTEWANASSACRKVASECLRRGSVPADRLKELLFPIEGYDGKLVIAPQPNNYNESFHFKANVIAGAASSSDYMYSLLALLSAQFDVVVIDLARSWGIATFSTLPLCQHVLLVCDDDPVTVERSLECLQRLKKESEDPGEFDFSRWSLLLNGYTGRLISPQELDKEIKNAGFLPNDAHLYVIPFSERGRRWGPAGRTFYDCAEPAVQERLREITSALIHFRYEAKRGLAPKFLRKWRSAANATSAR